MPDCRPPDGILPAAAADIMRPLHSSLALLIVLIAVVVPAVIALDVVAADEDENEIEDDDDVGDASSSCSSGATGSASSVVVRGADGRLATHTLIDVSAAASKVCSLLKSSQIF